MTHALLPLLLAALGGTPQADPAREAYDALLARYAQARGVELDFRVVSWDGESRLHGVYRLARPAAGRIDLQARVGRVEAVGDGARLWFLHAATSTCTPAEHGLADAPLVVDVSPLAAFLAPERVPEYAVVELVQSAPANRALRVLRCVAEGREEVLWLGAEGTLLAATVLKHTAAGAPQRTDFTFARALPHAEVQLDDWRVPVPEGYAPPPEPVNPYAELEARLVPVGATVPNVELRDLDGETFRLHELRGKTLLINFWYYHCPPCRAELPHLRDLTEELAETRGEEVVVLCVDRGDERDVIERYWRQGGFGMRAVQQERRTVSEAFGVQAYPTNFVVGPDALVRWRGVGWDEAAVRKALAQD